jgi:type I restriction enzyme M protein
MPGATGAHPITVTSMDANLNWIANFIWGIADDILRDLYVRGKYRDVILPMTVLRRLDALLEPTKQAILDMKASLDKAGIVHQDQALRQAAGHSFYNTSKFTLRDLKARANQQQLKADFEAYLDGFSPNVQDILEKFEFRNQIPRLSKADALGTLIEKLLSPDINLSPNPVLNGDGSVKQPGLDNHAMGTIFEELVRRFNEENNEEAGEHWTPRDAVKLMARLIFLPIADQIESGTYLLYDGACGTGGMLTVAEDTLQQLAREHGKQVATHLYGQEINAETYAIAKADLLLKGEGEAADNIVGGPEYSTLSNDAFPSREFDFMLSNPPYGKSWKSDLERMGRKGRDQGSALHHPARGRCGVFAAHAVERRPDAVPGQHAEQDEARNRPREGARKPHRRGAQRLVAVHRRRRSGREQHSPLDHRKRLARSHRRAAAEHVLQHGHCHLHLGADQPEARAPPGEGAAD